MIKKILLTLVLLILVGVVVLLVKLLPAHLQIRSVEPVLPSADELRAAFAANESETGSVQALSADLPKSLEQHPQFPNRLNYITTASQQTVDLGKLDYLSVVLSWPDGKRFLIDSGMGQEAAQEFGKLIQQLTDAEDIEVFGSVNDQLGEALDSVTGIALTHLHSDHTVGLTDICASRKTDATIFQVPTQAELQNHLTEEGQTTIEQSQCAHRVLDGTPIKQIPGFNGIFAVHAGGHTPGSTVYFAKIGDRIWVFAGDITNSLSHIHSNQPKDWLYSYLVVPEHGKQLEKLRLWLHHLDQLPDFTVLVAHDLQPYKDAGMQAWQRP